jgi:ParB family chromosome partitioning protein
METTVINATEYRELPLALLNESKTNPRRVFDDVSLRELAASIRSQGVLSPLLVRPLTENGFEIVAGARRYRAAQMAEAVTIPVRIKQMSDAEVLEAQLVENLIRAEIHPMEEAEGFARLLALEEPKYSIEQIAAKVGKHPSFVASRLKLVDLVPAAVDAFYTNEIGVGHALLAGETARRPAATGTLGLLQGSLQRGARAQRGFSLPVRNLQFWIETNVLLVLKDAPFDKRDVQLVAHGGQLRRMLQAHRAQQTAVSVMTSENKVTSALIPKCYQRKNCGACGEGRCCQSPNLVQISTAYFNRNVIL